jgi:hypothetical protein
MASQHLAISPVSVGHDVTFQSLQIVNGEGVKEAPEALAKFTDAALR